MWLENTHIQAGWTSAVLLRKIAPRGSRARTELAHGRGLSAREHPAGVVGRP